MAQKTELCHYLYPLNPKSKDGFVLRRGRKTVPTSREGFFSVLNYDSLDKWGIAYNANKVRIGDMIWVHFALPYSELGAVGRVEREAKWQPSWGRHAIWIRWDKELTEKLRHDPIPLAKYRQVPQFSTITANETTAKLLNRWLKTKRTPTMKTREAEIRFRTAEVEQRVGQSEFRSKLLLAYRNQCAVSGCAVSEVLQAAHIQPVKSSGNHSVNNGLLLRADLHNLFDRGMLTINQKYIITIAREIRTDPMYSKFHGKKLQVLPTSEEKRPRRDLLRKHQESHGIPSKRDV